MAITADLATFRILYPEFDAVSDATVTVYLDIYIDSVSELYFQECYNEAVLARSAHEIALSQNRQANAQTSEAGFTITSSSSGAITSASSGAISAGFSVPASQSGGDDNSAYLSLTQYGQQYLALMRRCLPYGIQTGACSNGYPLTSDES